MKYTFSDNQYDFQFIAKGALVGGITGVIIALFRYLLFRAIDLRRLISTQWIDSFVGKGLLFIGLLGIAILVGQLVKAEPNIGGSGIAEVKRFLIKPAKIHWIKELAFKFIGSVLVLGTGLNAGRVGPSVHIGAMVGLGMADKSNLQAVDKDFLVLAGAGAAISAIFNAPLAGIIFVVEVLYDHITASLLTCLLAACVVADLIAGTVFTVEPVFHLEQIAILPLRYYGMIVVLGVIVAFGGKYFNQAMMAVLRFFKYIPLKDEYLPLIPFLAAGFFYIFNPALLGGEYELLQTLSQQSDLILWVLGMIGIKALLIMITFGSKVPGGLFMPVLLLGALSGYAVGIFGVMYFGMSSLYLTNFMVFGMVGFFTASMKMPLTGSVLVLEMIGSFQHFLPVIMIALIAQVITDQLAVKPLGDYLVEKPFGEREE